MDTTDIIQSGTLLITLVALIIQQQRFFKEAQKKERRVETKLRIFKILESQERELDEDEIFKKLDEQSPSKSEDRAEIKKSLYEMLVEETVRYTNTKKYRPRYRQGQGGEGKRPG